MISNIAIATVAIGLLAASPESPQWEASYGKALEATRENQQPLLVVLDTPDSEKARVEPALLSEDSISSDSAKLLKPYELCHVDVSSEYGKKVAKAFHATSFPHVAIIDKTGSVILARKTGKIDAAGWEKMLSAHKDGNRGSSRAVSHVSYKPVDGAGAAYEGSSSFSSKPYCPSCQARQF